MTCPNCNNAYQVDCDNHIIDDIEVAHSANITAELFISKACEDRLAELDTINAGESNENIRLTQEIKGER